MTNEVYSAQQSFTPKALLGFLLALVLPGGLALPAAEPARIVSIVLDSSPGLASTHGISQLQSALKDKGWTTQRAASLEAASGEMIVLAGTVSGNGAAALALRQAGGIVSSNAEAL